MGIYGLTRLLTRQIFLSLETNKAQLATRTCSIDIDLGFQRGTSIFVRTSSISFNARYNSQIQNERIYFLSGINECYFVLFLALIGKYDEYR